MSGTKAAFPLGLKRVPRILEKTLLSPAGPEGSGAKVCDVVRGMLEAASMARVVAVIAEMARSPGRLTRDSPPPPNTRRIGTVLTHDSPAPPNTHRHTGSARC